MRGGTSTASKLPEQICEVEQTGRRTELPEWRRFKAVPIIAPSGISESATLTSHAVSGIIVPSRTSDHRVSGGHPPTQDGAPPSGQRPDDTETGDGPAAQGGVVNLVRSAVGELISA